MTAMEHIRNLAVTIYIILVVITVPGLTSGMSSASLYIYYLQAI